MSENHKPYCVNSFTHFKVKVSEESLVRAAESKHTIEPARVVLFGPYGGFLSQAPENREIPSHQVSGYA